MSSCYFQKIALVFTSLFLHFFSQAQDINRIDGSNISLASIDSEIQRLRESVNVHGLTVSIIRADTVLFKKAYGTSNIKENIPLSPDQNFYAASLSKPVFAYLVMKLVDQGIIDLDRPLVEYLDKPLEEYHFKHGYEGYQDIENDLRHKKITTRMCLAHTSGFPNWRYITKRGIDMENPLKIESDPGTYYSYSGEGIQFLQFVVEQITEKNLEELAQKYVFEPLEMTMTSFTWQERFENNYAQGHYKKKKVLPRRKRVDLYAAGSMDTTPQDYIKFVQAMLSRKGLSDSAFDEMFAPQIEIISKQQFGENRWVKTDANKPINLSYGLGWGHYTTPHGKATFKEGHIQGWEHHVVFYPEKNIGIIIMSNSSNADKIFTELLKITLADKWIPSYWEGYFSTR